MCFKQIEPLNTVFPIPKTWSNSGTGDSLLSCLPREYTLREYVFLYPSDISSTKAKKHNTNCDLMNKSQVVPLQHTIVLSYMGQNHRILTTCQAGWVIKQWSPKYRYQNSVTSANIRKKHTNTQCSMQSCPMLTTIQCRDKNSQATQDCSQPFTSCRQKLINQYTFSVPWTDQFVSNL